VLEVSPLIADSASNLLAARYQMAFTLGFHIILACFGVAFPAVMLIAEYRGRKHGDEDALRLARRWSKAVAVLFAVGAVSGTVLSFELGLLWPGMMDRFGDAFGIAFAIEGIFFFLEAIFIAIYIYGWNRLPGWTHFWSGVPIAISGIGGALSVIAANAWMNTPAGFTLGADGRVADADLVDVIFNTSTFHEFVHMWVAAYMVTGFLVASVYAVAMLRGRRDRYHRLGFLIRSPSRASVPRSRSSLATSPPATCTRTSPPSSRRWSACTRAGPTRPSTWEESAPTAR
jgi:cytochrome bd ubiquinol oxidase subunit I